MKKFCKLLPWLDVDLAVDLLVSLTDTNIGTYRFMELCEAVQVPAYLDCREWPGEIPAASQDDSTGAQRVIGAGICTIDHPGRLYLDDLAICITGPAKLEETERTMDSCKWQLDEYDESRPVIFKPADIEALAAKMNGTPEPQPEKPLHSSERKSAGQIIATLAAMAGVDLSAPYAADETLRAAAAAYGLELPSSPETVVKFLKDAAARAGKS